MSSFVLEYGSASGEFHVSIDMSVNSVILYEKDNAAIAYTCEEFESKYPQIIEEMKENGVIRPK